MKDIFKIVKGFIVSILDISTLWLIYGSIYVFKYLEQVNINTLFIITGVYTILRTIERDRTV